MTTVEEAQDYLRAHLDEGTECPVCTQLVKVYRRKINAGMARALIALYRESAFEFAHLARLAPWTHEGGQLAWWGLIEQDGSKREDGGQSGWWRLTANGRAFVHNQLKVPKYVHVYNGRVLRIDDTEHVSIIDALGTKFDYRELIGGL